MKYSDNSQLDKNGLDGRVFRAFAESSKRRYIYLCNLQTNVSRWSVSAIEYFGLPSEYMLDAGTIWESYIHPDDVEMYRADIASIFSGKTQYHNMEYRARNKDGQYVICTCCGFVLKGENGEPDLFAGTISNHGIVENVDSITNLYNIYQFMDAMRVLREKSEQTLILLIGLNHFDSVNSVYGYSFGNKVLRTFANGIKDIVRGNGQVYRLDGCKFAICMNVDNKMQTEIVYEKIQKMGLSQIFVEDTQIVLSVSGGAVFVNHNVAVGEFSIRSAVMHALDISKHERNGELVFFDDDSQGKSLRVLEMMDRLRKDIINGCQNFYLNYQPLVRAENGSVIGMEALIRWSNPLFGEAAPGVFIPWLENDPCFYDLGNWIMERALTDGKKIIEKNPDFLVHVNISYTQLQRTGFRDSVLEILAKTQFPPQNLYLELTERCRNLDLNYLKEEIQFFHTQNINIAIDDFGIGASSFSLIRELPLKCLKIDRSFISNIYQNKKDQYIVDAMLNCARNLDIEVCLEGVETEELRDFLQCYQADIHQGYFYSRPVNYRKFLELLD